MPSSSTKASDGGDHRSPPAPTLSSDSLMVGKNPLDDEQLQKLLKQVTSIDNSRQFLLWRMSFLKRYQEFLDQEGTKKAELVYKRFRKTALQPLILHLQRLRTHLLKDDITKRRCTVKARHTIGDLQSIVVRVTSQLQRLLPTTGEEQQEMGYSKFHMGALLIRDGFTEYARLTLAEEIFRHLQATPALVKHADVIFWKELDHYCTSLNVFIGILADLGLKMPLEKSRELMEEDEEEEIMTVADDGGMLLLANDDSTSHQCSDSVTNLEVSFVLHGSSHHTTAHRPEVVREEGPDDSLDSLKAEHVEHDANNESRGVIVLLDQEVVTVAHSVVTPEPPLEGGQLVPIEKKTRQASASDRSNRSFAQLSDYYHNSSSNPNSWRIADQIKQERQAKTPSPTKSPTKKKKVPPRVAASTPALLFLEGSEETAPAMDVQVLVVAPSNEMVQVENRLVYVKGDREDTGSDRNKKSAKTKPAPKKTMVSPSKKAALLPSSTTDARNSPRLDTHTAVETVERPPKKTTTVKKKKEQPYLQPRSRPNESEPYPSPYTTKESFTRQKAPAKSPGKDTLVTESSSTPYPEAYIRKEDVTRPKRVSATNDASTGETVPYPLPHKTREKVERLLKAKSGPTEASSASNEPEQYPEPQAKKKSVVRTTKAPPTVARDVAESSESYPPPHTTKDFVAQNPTSDKAPPSHIDSASLDEDKDGSEAASYPMESVLDESRKHSSSRPRKKALWFFRKPKSARESKAADNDEALSEPEVNPIPLQADSTEKSQPEDVETGDEPQRRSSSFWPFKNRSNEETGEEEPGNDDPTEKLESSDAVASKQPMFSFRKKKSDGLNTDEAEKFSSPPESPDEAPVCQPPKEKTGRFSLLRKSKDGTPTAEEGDQPPNPDLDSNREAVERPQSDKQLNEPVEKAALSETLSPTRKAKSGILSLFRRQDETTEPQAEDQSPYPQAHVTREEFSRPRAENSKDPVPPSWREEPLQYPKAQTKMQVLERQMAEARSDRDAGALPSKPSRSEPISTDEKAEYPRAHVVTEESVWRKPLSWGEQRVASKPTASEAIPQAADVPPPSCTTPNSSERGPETKAKSKDSSKIFSFLRKDKTNIEPRDKAAKRQQYPEACTKTEKAERAKVSTVPQTEPTNDLVEGTETLTNDQVEPTKSEKPRLLSFLRKKNGDDSPEDLDEADGNQSYPKPHTTREEVTRPKADGNGLRSSIPRSELSDRPDDNAKSSEPQLPSFLHKRTDDQCSPFQSPLQDGGQACPVAHTTRVTVSRPDAAEESTAGCLEPASVRPKAYAPASDVSKRSLWPFQRKATVPEPECAPNDVEQPYPPLHSRTATQTLDRPNERLATTEGVPYPELHKPTARDTIDRSVAAAPYPEYDKGFALEAPGRLAPAESAEGCESGQDMMQLTNGDDDEFAYGDADCSLLQITKCDYIDGVALEEVKDCASIGAHGQLQLALMPVGVDSSQQPEVEATGSNWKEPSRENEPAQSLAAKADRASMKNAWQEIQQDVSHQGTSTSQDTPSSSSPPKSKPKKTKISSTNIAASTPSVAGTASEEEPPAIIEITPSGEDEPKGEVEPPPVIRLTQTVKKIPTAASRAPLASTLGPVKEAALQILPKVEPVNVPQSDVMPMVVPVHSPRPEVVPTVEPIRALPSPPPPVPPPPSPPTPPNPVPVVLTEERRKKCYMWYARLGQPNRETMKRKVKALPDSCDITVEEVDALPWVGGGMCLSVKAMNELFLNPEDAE